MEVEILQGIDERNANETTNDVKEFGRVIEELSIYGRNFIDLKEDIEERRQV